MSLTKEDLQAISDLMDSKLNEQEIRTQKRFDQIDDKFDQIDQRFEQIDQRFEKIDQRFEQIDQRFGQIDQRFEQIDQRFGQMEVTVEKKLTDFKEEIIEIIKNNNTLIAEHVSRVVKESEDRLVKQITEIRAVTAENCYSIASLKTKIS